MLTPVTLQPLIRTLLVPQPFGLRAKHHVRPSDSRGATALRKFIILVAAESQLELQFLCKVEALPYFIWTLQDEPAG